MISNVHNLPITSISPDCNVGAISRIIRHGLVLVLGSTFTRRFYHAFKARKINMEAQIINLLTHHLATITEIVTSLLEQFSDLFSGTCNSSSVTLMKNAGFWGSGRSIVSFVSIETTVNIVGLSLA